MLKLTKQQAQARGKCAPPKEEQVQRSWGRSVLRPVCGLKGGGREGEKGTGQLMRCAAKCSPWKGPGDTEEVISPADRMPCWGLGTLRGPLPPKLGLKESCDSVLRRHRALTVEGAGALHAGALGGTGSTRRSRAAGVGRTGGLVGGAGCTLCAERWPCVRARGQGRGRGRFPGLALIWGRVLQSPTSPPGAQSCWARG